MTWHLPRRPRWAALLIGAASALAATGCGSSGGADVAATPVGAVELSTSALNLRVGAQAPIVARVMDQSGRELVGRPVFWSVRNADVARVDQSGVVQAVAPGVTEVSANVQGQSATATVTVTARSVAVVRIDPVSVALNVGGSTTLRVEALDDAGSAVQATVAWTTDNAAVATVSSAGVVTATGPGAAVVSATAQGQRAAAVVTVAAPRTIAGVLVDPASVSLTVGGTRALTARAVDASGATMPGTATWTSQNAQIATVSSTGEVRGVAPGVTTVRATIGDRTADVAVAVGQVPAASVRITPSSETLSVGDTRQLTATVLDANGAPLAGRTVAWTSRAPGVASVSSTGLVSALSPGTATIVASIDGVNAEATITVRAQPVASVLLTPQTSTLSVGGTVQLTAVPRDAAGNPLTGRTVSFTTSDPSVATVDGNGLVKAVGPGTAQIRATSEGASATSTITVNPIPVARVDVTPSTATVQVGATVALTATPRAADGTPLTGRTVTWTSGGPSVATVSAAGVVTGVSAGTAQILASVDGVVGSATITVPAPPTTPPPTTPPPTTPPPTTPPPPTVATVTVTPATATLICQGNTGRTVDLTATARDAQGNVVPGATFTWATSNATLTSITANGATATVRANACPSGTSTTVTITATSGAQSGQSTLTVRRRDD